MGQVLAASPFNSNQFEFVGQVAETTFWSLRLDFLTKIGRSHEGTWSPGLIAGTSPLECTDLKSKHFTDHMLKLEKMSVWPSSSTASSLGYTYLYLESTRNGV